MAESRLSQEFLVPRPSLDTARLQKEARIANSGSRRSTLGTTALLREHLDEINALKAEGVTFAAIAEALGKQGVVQGQGDTQKPITASRLTALYSQLKRTDAKRAARRSARADAIVPPPRDEHPHKEKRKIALAPELTRKASSSTKEEPLPDEEAIRREGMKRAQRFVKKPSS